MKPLRLEFKAPLGMQDIWVDEEVWSAYLTDYSVAYAKKRAWYSIGKMSGHILHEGRTYGEIAQFAENLPSAKALEENINRLNPTLLLPYQSTAVSYGTWISIDEKVLEACKEAIEAAIINEIGYVPQKDLGYEFVSYDTKEDPVVYVSFYKACHWSGEIYAVPLDIAYELFLGDYEGKEMDRFDDLWHTLEPYEVELDVEYDEDGHVIKAPYQMIEVYNYD